jgi:hypothetical protein
MQKERRDQRVFQCGLRLGHFRADARFTIAIDDQSGLDEELYLAAQRPVKPGNAKWLRLVAFLQRDILEPECIDPTIGGIEIATDLNCSRRAIGLPQDAAMRRHEARMQDRKLKKAAGSQDPSCLAQGTAVVGHVHHRHESCRKIERA